MTFPHGALLLRYEVAALFKVEPKTISRWTAAGKLHPVTMPGGRYRFLAGEVHALRAGQTLTPQQIEALLEALMNGGGS